MSNKEDTFELHREIIISGGSAAAFHGNVSTYHNTTKNLSYAAIAHRYQVNIVSWDAKLEGFAYDSIMAKDPGYGQASVVIQAKYVSVKTRVTPLLVVCAMDGFALYDVDNKTPLTWQPVISQETDTVKFAKGVGVSGHYICVGDHVGNLHVLSIGESSVRVKPNIKEHAASIIDIADDQRGDMMVSVSADGVVVCWDTALKAVNKISTGLENASFLKTSSQPLSCAATLRGMVVCGTLLGQILVYSIGSGELLVEMLAHARVVTCIDSVSDPKMFVSTSEDSFIRVWKISPKKNEKTVESAQVDCMFSQNVENAPLVGCCFNDAKGSSFAATAYDHAVVFYYKFKRGS